MPEQSSQCIPVLDIVFSRLQDRGLPAIDLVVCTHFQAHKMSGILLPEGDYIKPLKGLMYNYSMVTFQTEAGTIFCAMTVS